MNLHGECNLVNFEYHNTMLNLYTLNEFEIGHSVAPEFIEQDDFVFDGYSLQNSEIIMEMSDYDDLGKIDFNTFNFPRNNGGGVISKFYRGRTVGFTGIVRCSTAVLLNEKVDEIKRSISATEGYLDIKVNGNIRRAKATCVKMDFGRQHYHVSFIPVRITFEILEPFFYSINDQSGSYLGKTGNFSEEFTCGGTAETEPTFYFIFGTTTVTGMTITNPDATTLVLAEAITTGDVLIINSKEKEIKLNGTVIDYTGVFPTFRVGSNPFSVSFTGSVNVDVSLITAKNYL